jgi:hypothetical protein
MPGIKGTVNMDQIKLHYFASHPDLNKWSIIPKGVNFKEKSIRSTTETQLVRQRRGNYRFLEMHRMGLNLAYPTMHVTPTTMRI